MTADDPSIDQGLRGAREAAEALAAALDLAPQDVPAELRRLPGDLRGAPIALHTRRLAGARWALTLAEITAADGALIAFTAIGLPAGAPAPILGVDLVAVQGALSLVAVDLAPTDDEAWSAAEPALVRLHHATAELVVPRRRPEFADEVFSPRALIAGARRGREAAALAAVAAFLREVAPIVAATTATPTVHRAADERRRRWCLAERRNRREHDALARMFGAGPASSYSEFLFPSL